MEQKPSIGRIVHYHEPGELEPTAAVITRVEEVQGRVRVNLTVFPDQGDPYNVVGAGFSENPDAFCWGWPPRV